MKFFKIIISTLLVIGILWAGPGYAQAVRDEVTENREEAAKVEEFAKQVRARKVLDGVIYKHLKVTYGYDTNPLLGTNRQADDYESLRMGMDYRRTFAERNQYALSGTITQQNYNEITDLTNTLLNLNLDYKFALTKQYIIGAGYNFIWDYYSKNSDNAFFSNKSYINFQHRISAKFYHKLQYEFSVKHYEEARALFTSTSTYKHGRRRDLADAFVYAIGYTMTERFSSNVSLKYMRNDANSDYQNYYDYNTYELTPRLFYKFSDALSGTLAYSFKFKRYDDRLAGSSTDEQVDRIARLDVGLNYILNESHSFSLNYSYNGNDSNNSLSDYDGSSIELGWRYDF